MWSGIGPVLGEYIPPTATRSQPHPIPEGEVGLERMIRAAKNAQQVALVTLGGYVGCSISEALEADLFKIDLKRRTMLIVGKADRQRLVPLSDKAIFNLQSSIIEAVTNPGHKLITYQDRFARQVIKNLGLRAGLQREVASHDLRATFAHLALTQTDNIRLVQELLGRVSAEMTHHGITMNELRKAVDF